jgi:cell wall-associated NlpC family hydrolase
MTDNWTIDFIGRPYKHDGEVYSDEGYSCRGLIKAVYSRVYGIELGDLLTEAGAGKWSTVAWEDEREGDVIVFALDRRDLHVGLVIEPGRMMHADEWVGKVIVESFRNGLWKPRWRKTYRHCSR